MSNAFRDLLRKIGSGNHTGENLTRTEAFSATKMMLLGEATPAQIGAFLIAHRIKRPTGEELAGMLDAYDELGPQLQDANTSRPPIVMGIPYDGRSRTSPISIITALILAQMEQPVIMHGSDRMPTKYGLPLVEVWHSLGVDWTKLQLAQTQEVFAQTGIGLIYLPQHFPFAQTVFEYRDQIGKRPPLATMELIWCPYAGTAHIIAGFVHPPTEGMFLGAFALRGTSEFTTIKGLEGSCDLPRDRTAIIGLSAPTAIPEPGLAPLQRLQLTPREYDFTSYNVPLKPTAELVAEIQSVLEGKPSELMQSTLWNTGFYLWRSGVSPTMRSGIALTEELLTSGQVAKKLIELQTAASMM